MNKIKKGRLYITKEDILNYFNLSDDTQISAIDISDGIEIEVVTNGDNNHEWLETVDQSSTSWNMKRIRIPLDVKPKEWSLTPSELVYMQDLTNLLLTFKELDMPIDKTLEFIRNMKR